MLGAYLAQSLALAVTGTALGMLLALVVNVFGTRALAQLSPLALEAGLTWRASVQGAAIALLVTMLFALPALLEVRQVNRCCCSGAIRCRSISTGCKSLPACC